MIVEKPLYRNLAEQLDSSKPSDIERAAQIVMDGGIIAFPFNGVFGLFGDIYNPSAADKIYEAKARPTDKKLVVTYLPEHFLEITDIKKMHIEPSVINTLWSELHALGVILPASTHAPYHLVQGEHPRATILQIWTEYEPLRRLSEHLRAIGGKALVATSANKSGQATHWRYEELYEDFKYDVDGIVKGDFSHLPEIRRRSTSVVDFTNSVPRLHREGNVSEQELNEALTRHNLQLKIGRDVITVRGRK